jgi:hypothetical protein
MFRKVLLGLIAIGMGICLVGIPKTPDVDSVSYRLMAEGRVSEVVRPYANRVLHPLVVRGTEEVLAWGSPKVQKSETRGDAHDNACVLEPKIVRALLEFLAFFIVAAGSLTIALSTLAALTPGLSAVPFAVFVASPVLCLYCINICLQDLFVLALTALFFLALTRKKYIWSLVLLFLLQTARESTVVLALTVAVLAGLRHQWKWAVGTVATVVCAMLVVAVLSRDAQHNIHAMGGFAYLATKILANGADNLFGVTVWSDTYARQLPHYYPDAPLWKFALPTWARLGDMTMLGVYRLDFWRPFEVLIVLSSAFGVLPVVLLKCVSGRSFVQQRGSGPFSADSKARATRVEGNVSGWTARPLALAVAAGSGLIYFVASPFAGRTVERQIGYAWPLFWLALLWTLKPECRNARQSEAALGAFLDRPVFWSLQIACMWWPIVLARSGVSREAVCLLGIAGVGVCFFAVHRQLREKG